ncbi:hypothetical protein SPRG_20090 [Saprolegnia parasitica CBS 223.65]|uniref:ubiquitinyl hydrolase 1 n=1 Tax=Saprolegnia parasitica (strain CBS 223.65) TaxID=695850 RepID=A0A067CR16_SAPPC|nr:hypothetical protein SPRG_20090 [Saprolegnia parasitica CBS 223.65]KDO28986.1 hypothetical protein SPRG_20090 [Saprolegnia parasitica CBS 223.65]|eukprot:XP_012200318.1 hypothetical protein SPRG_20090 [Saprolegnia parasitica CBS 223.65]
MDLTAGKIWKVDACIGMMGDPYIGATELDGGQLGNGLLLVSHFLGLEDDDRVKAVAASLRDAVPWAQTQTKDAKEFTDVMGKFKDYLRDMQIGTPYIIPGGWVGKLSRNAVVYIVEKTAADEYSFTVCNRGPGSDYHPTDPTQLKMKVQSCATIAHVPASRMLDLSFWSLAFSLWLKNPPSEYHRMETLYDVLLPWLADSVLPLAFATSPDAYFCTPQRSNTGFVKNVVEAAKFLLRKRGLSAFEIKRIMFRVRWNILKQMRDDLIALDDPTLPFKTSAVEAIQALAGISLIDSLQGSRQLPDVIADAPVIGVYFASLSCPACKTFRTKLIRLCDSLTAAGRRIAIIVVPLDSTDEEYQSHLMSLPVSWACVPIAEMAARKKLVQAFHVSKMPLLVVMDATGAVKTPLGVELVLQDPIGAHYPWVPSDTFQLPLPTLSDTEGACIHMALKQTGLSAIKQNTAGGLLTDDLVAVHELIQDVDAKRALIAAKTPAPEDTSKWQFDRQVPLLPFEHMEHFKPASVDGYAGNVAEAVVPVLASMLDVPERVGTIELAAAAFIRCEGVCQSLLQRAGDGSSSSRVALHHEVIQLVTTLFTETIPVPSIADDDMWRQPVGKELQFGVLKSVHNLVLILGIVWQSIERPSRSLDATRALASICALAMYDAMLRAVAVDTPMEMSLLMAEGYVLANSFCQNSRTLLETARAMELVQPSFAVVRGRVLAYFASLNTLTPLFELRMPDEKVELKKYSTTFGFLRKLMELYNYPLIAPDDANPPSEMEALVDWFLSDSTPLAEQHPEMAQTRDLVTMCKFLCTMETREDELMRRRTGLRQWQMWSLTFDEATSRYGRRFNISRNFLAGKLKWEVAGFRGIDQDIADIDVSGFTQRKLFFGEGPVVVSPASLPPLLQTSLPVVTEDDVMHTDALPLFQGTLSSEESEYLLSYLTVPYTRIPLVLGFFASRDRVMYLFNPLLQTLLRAVLFEGGDWVLRTSGESSAEMITHVPLRKSGLVLQEEALEQVLDARVHHQKAADHLGTMNGLLLNELSHAPEATVRPILIMLQAITELGEASVHSSDASFILYMLQLSVDVLRYVTFAVYEHTHVSATTLATLQALRSELVGQLFGFGLTTLDKWRMEAEAKDDLRTACVIHSYMALLFMNLRVDEYTPARLVTLLGSVAYVRNWHCFGMHVLLEDESELSSEQRLLRWLQAHGIDTKNVATGSLDKYLTDRPVGMEIIQAPSILKKKPKEDATTVLYPPAGVLESELFELLQAKRRSIVEFAQSLSPNDCNALLNSILHIALRAKTVPTHEWTMDAGVAGTGRYVCTQAEMKIDLQTGEILWRNDELKPVPDSMVQFSDYRHHFGNEALHCGLSPLGTECELMEWDEPSPDDQGVDTPTVFLPPVPAATPAVPSDAKMYWECPACTCANFNGDQPNAACEVCATPKHVPAPTPAPAQPAEPTETGFLYLGTEYSRRLDPYSKDEHEIESELWFVSLVRSVVNALFPEDDPAKKLPFSLFLPTSVAPETAPHVTLLALHKNDKSDFLSTFKEMIVYRHYNVLHVFSLISHGRRLHRKLLFTSNARLALHSFVPNVEGAGESVAPSVQYAAGDIMELQSSGNSLVILRRNKSLHGVETYLPPRFLQGLIPSAFLEAFKFWQGEDGILRGEPLDDESQWFKYQLEIQLKHNKVAYVVRKAIDAAPTLIQHTLGQPSVIAPPPAPIAVPPTPPPMRQEMVIADEDVVQLMSLGFSYSGCVLALKESGNSVEEAAMWLLDEANQTRILQADEIPEEALEASLREQQLVEAVMAASSVSRIAATYALELFNHDDTLATAWLCEPDNADEIARMEADTRGGDADTSLPNAPRLAKQASEGEQADAKRVKMTHGGELVLLNPLHIASPDSTMARIAHVLGRIEDLSHVLIWTATLPTALLQHETESDPVGELSQIALIELPRLKLRFEPRRGDDGRVHLYMVDQREWFICLDDMSKLSAPLRALATSMPDAVVLATSRDEYRFLCANHDVYRPMVQGVPFSTVVVPNRASAGWQQVMETRYYLYPVHASQTFVLTPSLSSTLYLILLALMNRQYKSAAQYIATCHVDVPFTDEEQWIFNQIEKTLQDRHPDACACRVRLALAIQYSENKCSWRLADELHVVSTSVAHVQAECRLNAQEELDALALCENMSPLLQVRMALCVAEQRKQMDTDVKPARLRVGGQPWVKLNMLTAAYLEEHATTLSTVRYKRPSALLADEECMKLIWDNEIVGDEASGANRGLGCLFLYECLNGHVSLRLHGEEYTRSMADLLARFLHLKLARWGKEVVEDGEEECSVSIAMSQVAVVLSNPYHAWPALPVDRDSTHMLERGVNLYSKHLKDSMLKNFFDMTTMEFQTLLVANSDRVIPPLRQQLTHAHKTLPETVRRARAGAFPFPLAVKPSDASCAERVFTLGHDALHPFVPLSFFRAEDYVVHCRPERELATQLPFDLSAHPAAQSVVAKDLLQRLADDVKNHAETTNHTLEPFFVGVSRLGFDGATCVAKLETLIAASHAQRAKDEAFVLATIATLEARVNVVEFSVTDTPSTRLAKCRFLVERFAQQHTPIDFAYLASTLASSDMAGDLARKNPFVDVAQLPTVLQLVQLVLFCANRMSHLNRLIGSAAALKSLVESHVLYQNQDASRMLHASQDVANGLLASRHYLKERDGQTYAYDPRYLLFEFVFELLLRQRQVEMVESFMTSMHNGVSRVQQMIMGAGKTTVVGPLLTYMLADSKVLVTHVMPTALLEQSRAVLRSRFSNAILQKRIFTLSFDRSVDDDPMAILALASKLQRACVHADVICASPEAIKSLLLKFVELLHSLEQSTHDPDFRLHDTSRTGMRIRKVLHSRADMADELQVVLRQWQRGVLIMDEVDVLLHPLRSELNFPIGNKFPIDLAANRWELPMHLLDVVLSSSSSSPLHAELHTLLHEGYNVHALQRFPHLVLLDVAYYDAKLRPILARVAYEWLSHHFKMGKCTLSMDDVIYYLQCDRVDLGSQSHIENGLSEHGLKLLNLGREWIRTLLPHCLSKINRVSYGLLQKQHFESNGNTPSRLLLAVPFVGKDVPSRSSEFAHPDVLIGLTILAYRYEGVRRTDIKTVVAQLKHDFSRQLGPREQRPACALFRSWVLEGLALAESTSGVLPLPLFQLNDASQVTRLLQLVRLLPSVVHYYVRQHVFPSCMNFQKLKVSACGHELGSDSLFAKRIGFSGTPSNLLPLDLGDCHYEPQSDGNIFSVLTSARVTTLERKLDWTATSLLRDIATHDPPFHALIDTGALITGLDNEEVARFLLTHLPLSMEGVVYLDPSDRQMILLRDHAAAMPLVQCGLGPEKRFTFYDQVHTTGMDIKQCTSARAVLTLGKDMTFRDYAQGAYRMRGIGAGQTIHLYLIPEVENRIRQEVATGPVLLDDFRLLVPAWLLVNSMKMESMQLVQLSLQELHNTWRKRALYALLDEVDAHRHGQNATQRLLRFQGNDWLRQCIDAFRVQVSYAVAAQLPLPKAITDTMAELTAAHAAFVQTPAELARIETVQRRVSSLSGHVTASSDMHLNAEVVHENEAEAEEEAEEEAEQEEQKMSAYTRDDEHPVPWSTDALKEMTGDSFYPMARFQAHTACPSIAFPVSMLVSDNYFRPRWIGLGERRLKNVGFLMEWHPLQIQSRLRARITTLFVAICAQQPGIAPTDAAAQAIQLASQSDLGTPDENEVPGPVYVVALSLAEGETLRRMIHCAHPIFAVSGIQLRTADGALVEASHASSAALTPTVQEAIECFRFFNGEMYYTAPQMDHVLAGLADIPLHLRHEFFMCCLRLRRRERQLWGDTPLAKVFTKSDEWHLLSARAKMEQFQRGIRTEKIPLLSSWHRFDGNNDGVLSYDELLRCFESFQLGFSPSDLNEIIGLVETAHEERGVSIAKLCAAFHVDPTKEHHAAKTTTTDGDALWMCSVCTYTNEPLLTACAMCSEPRDKLAKTPQATTWTCENCTCVNPILETTCSVCEMGMSGRREVPKDKWVCDPDQGGCTFFNPLSSFYCDVCNRARPDLASHRF